MTFEIQMWANKFMSIYPIAISGVHILGQTQREMLIETWQRPLLPYWDLSDSILEMI